MTQYLFLLGQASDLCFAELQVVLARYGLPIPERITEFLGSIEVETTPDLAELQKVLGGTIKIVRVVDHSKDTDEESVTKKAGELLTPLQPKRYVVAEHGRDHLSPIDQSEIKNVLAEQGIKSSYTETPRYGANSAQLTHQNLTELHVIQLPAQLIWAVTETWQNVDEWSERDVEKPMRDRQRGMLPTKVAHMLVNLAVGEDHPANHVVLDPFCGMGTVLIEATALGVPTVLGNDIDSNAVMASNKNMAWWKAVSGLEFDYEFTVRATEKLQRKDFTTAPTVIVTEPFLGKLTPKDEQVPGIIRGLEKMYKGSIKSFAELLPEGGRLVWVLPEIKTRRGQTMTVKNTLKDLEEQGFKQIMGPLRAGRQSAITQRQVYVLEYSPYVTR